MTVYDLGLNRKGCRVGDYLTFKVDYMGVANLMNSKFIEKRIIQSELSHPV